MRYSHHRASSAIATLTTSPLEAVVLSDFPSYCTDWMPVGVPCSVFVQTPKLQKDPQKIIKNPTSGCCSTAVALETCPPNWMFSPSTSCVPNFRCAMTSYHRNNIEIRWNMMKQIYVTIINHYKKNPKLQFHRISICHIKWNIYETNNYIDRSPYINHSVQGTQQPTTRHSGGSEGPAQILPRRGAWPTNVAESKPPGANGSFRSFMVNGWLTDGSWMVHGWFMDGSWMVHGWFMDGSWMVHGWFMDGSWMVNAWFMDGWLMVDSWLIGIDIARMTMKKKTRTRIPVCIPQRSCAH